MSAVDVIIFLVHMHHNDNQNHNHNHNTFHSQNECHINGEWKSTALFAYL